MELEKLIGKTAKLSFLAPSTWTLAFGCGAEFSNFSICRISKEKQLLACTKDHDQWFGLKEPYDAEKEINNHISNGVITGASFGLSSNDIVLSMSTGIVIEILSISTGYETWEYRCAEGILYVASGAGNVNEF
ncbi:hypothetical protein [Cellvibrio sp. pealriver]|uniref:hypothetical protein n=1 Tax=Cellvibrio sp. pealriver TaxID=1622269 RepID=UPI00066FC5B0|nr:hypothetical protein [Cellvibrio sp. pealriver]